jgi:hypothetical protein
LNRAGKGTATRRQKKLQGSTSGRINQRSVDRQPAIR